MTATIVTKLVGVECYKCHVLFAMTEEHNQECRNTGASFYCPSGHSQVYRTTELERMRRQVERAEREREAARERAEFHEQRAERHQRSAIAMRGVVTRTKNRIAKGKCPCCRVTFTNLRQHMDTAHPEYAGERK